jgi:short-subunit dehydrogenase
MEAAETTPLAVVAGASSGIGFELAQVLAENGFDLLISSEDHRLDEAKRTLAANGTTVEAVRADLSRSKGVDKLYEGIQKLDGPVDVLALNAGIGEGGDFVRQTDLEQELTLVDLNVRSTVHLSKLVLRDMMRRGEGRVLFTSSIASTMPGTYQAVYNASKSFVQSFALAIRRELKGTGVSVTSLMPGQSDRHGLLPSCPYGGHPRRLLRAEGRSGRGGAPGVRGSDGGEGTGGLGIARQQAAHLRRALGPGQAKGGGSPVAQPGSADKKRDEEEVRSQ